MRWVRRLLELLALLLLLAWLGVLTYVSYSGWQARQEAMARSEETIEEALADPANRARIGEALKEKVPGDS